MPLRLPGFAALRGCVVIAFAVMASGAALLPAPLSAAEPAKPLQLADLEAMDPTALERAFQGGAVPKMENLAGDVRGRGFYPASDEAACSLCAAAVRAFLGSPLILWAGKRFERRADGRWAARNLFFTAPDGHAAFPMRPVYVVSAQSRRKVLMLDYRVEGDPPVMQRVYDELVEIGPNLWLGRAYFKDERGGAAPWLWFALEKPN